jgi:hypothetical protein
LRNVTSRRNVTTQALDHAAALDAAVAAIATVASAKSGRENASALATLATLRAELMALAALERQGAATQEAALVASGGRLGGSGELGQREPAGRVVVDI